jgi:hypothetical protein
MVFPGLPPDSREPQRKSSDEAMDDVDIDVSRIRRPPGDDGEMTGGDWLLCIFCSGIACIIGIIRLIQGKPGAGKFFGIALFFTILWSILRALFEAMSRGPGF